MRKLPRLSAAAITDRIARLDRGPVQEYYARVLAATPSPAKLKEWAHDNPFQHGRLVAQLAKPAGYADRTEALNLHVSAESMAREAVSRFGPDRARQALTAMGLPSSLVDQFDKPVDSITVDRAQPDR